VTGRPKFSPKAFAARYAPLRAKGLSREEIADKMSISTKTLERYLANPDYESILSTKTEDGDNKDIEKAKEKSTTIISAAYRLHEKGIADAVKKKDWKVAREISIEALKIARTEADIKRVVNAISGPTINITYNNVSVFYDRLDNMQKDALIKEVVSRAMEMIKTGKSVEHLDVLVRSLVRVTVDEIHDRKLEQCPACGQKLPKAGDVVDADYKVVDE